MLMKAVISYVFHGFIDLSTRHCRSMMRSAALTAASLALTTAVLGNAWLQRHQFYPSVVYITKSNPSMAVIYLQVTES